MEGFDVDVQVKEIKKDTWMISGRGCTAYLVVGDKFGVMVDTGEYYEDLHALVETITDKPVEIVLNTHGHFDHTGGNGHFKVALMGRLAAEIAKQPNGPSSEEIFERFKIDYEIIVVDDGFKIDLGGRVLEAFMIDGHSPDSIAWLDHREKILFGGDAVSMMVPNMYKCPDPQPSIILYIQSLAKLMARRSEFDWLAAGHAHELLSGDVVDDIMICALRALHGECDERPARRPGGPGGPGGHGGPGGPGGPGGQRKGKSPMDAIPEELRGFVTYGQASIAFHKGYVHDTTRYDIVQGT